MTLAVKDGIVTDGNGLPAAQITVTAAEKVGLPNYSNVTMTASYTKWIEDGDASHIEAELHKAAQIVEGHVAEEREAVLQGLKGE